MADYTDISTKQLIFNLLTKSKFDNLSISSDIINKLYIGNNNEVYAITDAEASYTQSESDAKYATKTELSTGLNSKQNAGDYVTNIVLNEGLATKVNISQGSENVDKILIIGSNGNVSLSTNIITDYALVSSLTSHTSNVNNPHKVTKAQVGLGNVNNTSDLNKPISTATQTALDLKANKADVYTKTEIDNTKADKKVPISSGNVAKLDSSGNLMDGGALGKLAVKDTVSSNDIVDNSIISNKIKDSAVGSSKIIDGAITDVKIAENAAISISKINGLQDNLDSKLNINQGVENYNKIVSVGEDGLLTLTDNEGITVDGIGLLFEEKMFPIPIDDVRLVPLNNPGQTTGTLYEGFSSRFPDAWNLLIEAKAKAVAGEAGYERYNKTQEEYDAELLRTTIYDTDGSTVLKMGFCGFFVIDEANDTVRFPFKGDAFDRGQVNGVNVDTLDQIRNITGNFSFVGSGSSKPYGSSSGVFKHTTVTGGNQIDNVSGASTVTNQWQFNASNVVPTGIENQPRAQGKFYYLVLGNAVDNVSEVKIRESIDNYVNDTTIPYISEEGNKWVDNVRNVMGTFISSARNNIPYGTLKCDGLSYSDELGLNYDNTNFPDLYDALVKGNLKSVSIDVFDSLVANNGWCGVFGLQQATPESTETHTYYAYSYYALDGEYLYFKGIEAPSSSTIMYQKTTDGNFYESLYSGYISGGDTVIDSGEVPEIGALERYSAGDETVIITIEAEPALFKTPKITNVSQQNVIPNEDGSNKNLGRVLIKSQAPTEENNYIWYNIYNDGWVEQGGQQPSNTGASGVTVNLPVEMANSNYTILAVVTQTEAYFVSCLSKTATTFLWRSFNTSTQGYDKAGSWELSGYASTGIIENLIQSNDNFFIQCYNTTKEVSIADYEESLNNYIDNTLKPELDEYIDDLKPELQDYTSQAKDWAVSDNIVDEARNLYSAKHYAEQTEKNYMGIPLLTPYWHDHILNDIRWLRAETFSWHLGDVYKAAYEHLASEFKTEQKKYYAWSGLELALTFYTEREAPLAGDILYTTGALEDEWTEYGVLISDYDGGDFYISSGSYGAIEVMRSESNDIVRATGILSDTIDGITISYYLAEDGHKICFPDQESNLVALYNATGVAWYYILDTDNKQFKLPRISPDKENIAASAPVTLSASGALKLRQNGAGTTDIKNYVNSGINTFGAYNTSGTINNTGSSGSGSAYMKYESGITGTTDLTNAISYFAGKKYLYFYVGNYMESVEVIDAGKLSEIISEFDINEFKPEVDDVKNAAIDDISVAKTDAIGDITNIASDLGTSLKYGNVGDIFYTSRLDVSLNGAVECNGNLYNTTDFSGTQSIGNLLKDRKVPYISLAEHQITVDTYGSCRCFGWDGGTTFRVPKLTDVFIEAGVAASEGEFITAGLPNITGALSVYVRFNSAGDAFELDPAFTGITNASGSSYTASNRATFDASRSSSVYGNSTTVQPPAVRYRAMVQLAFGATDDAVVTAGNVVADVSMLKNRFFVPDYGNGTILTANATHTVPSNGYLLIRCNENSTTGSITINGTTIAISYLYKASADIEGGSLSTLPVAKGDVFSTTVRDAWIMFCPVKYV